MKLDGYVQNEKAESGVHVHGACLVRNWSELRNVSWLVWFQLGEKSNIP